MGSERRRSERLQMDLPIQVKTQSGEIIDMELVDVSSTGLQILGDNLSIFDQEEGRLGHRVQFEVRVVGRLDWVEPKEGGKFAMGLEFGLSDDDAYIG